VIGILTSADLTQTLSESIRQGLHENETFHYKLHTFSSDVDLLHCVEQEQEHKNRPIDCLILQESSSLWHLLDRLQQHALFFPTVILQPGKEGTSIPPAASTGMPASTSNTFSYNTAVFHLPLEQINQIRLAIDQAISKFIQLSPPAPSEASITKASNVDLLTHKSLMAQQLRLAEKLKERLGYLGVYYKRNPKNFLRSMTQPQRQELLRQLKAGYREIVLGYFSDEPHLNDKIDNFVNTAFFADVPVSQVVEVHMELMDDFSKHLKLEGRSDEVLLDYRLTLIDTIAHLCEMYRRSIPRDS
jgi:circadian clock protein KaiA